MEERTEHNAGSENDDIVEIMQLQKYTDNPAFNGKKMRSANYTSQKKKAEGGKTTASFMKSARAGERPRMIGDAISGDLTDGIKEFVSRVSRN